MADASLRGLIAQPRDSTDSPTSSPAHFQTNSDRDLPSSFKTLVTLRHIMFSAVATVRLGG